MGERTHPAAACAWAHPAAPSRPQALHAAEPRERELGERAGLSCCCCFRECVQS